jgi:hypothetical protein
MRRMMIGDRRRRHPVGLEASSAERLDLELMTSPLSPTLQAVQSRPGRDCAGLAIEAGMTKG